MGRTGLSPNSPACPVPIDFCGRDAPWPFCRGDPDVAPALVDDLSRAVRAAADGWAVAGADLASRRAAHC